MTTFYSKPRFYAALICSLLAVTVWVGGPWALGQVDEGTVTGVVTDPTGAVIPHAEVTLTNTNTGLVLHAKANAKGSYVFSPVVIGPYKVTASAPKFQTTSLSGLTVNLNQTLQANLTLQPGSVSQTVTVKAGAAQLLQTEQSSTGQVMSAKAINHTPLNGRNYVFVAQLAAGVVQSAGSRGEGTGDFSANGLPAEQNDFVLDGVDNNSNLVDFLNGASYVVEPPPDALSEFKVQTSDYDAQFGHSAGAVLNAEIKSGTNRFNGDLWEYFRNQNLEAKNFFSPEQKPPFRQNQFGGTIGGPILKNHLFFFGDVQATRIRYSNTGFYTVPTPLMRKGNFTELLNPALTGSSQPITLYEPGSDGTQLMQCNGQQNVLCSSQIDPTAQKILNLYPMPNTNNGKTYNNYKVTTTAINNTVDWDAKLSLNLNSKNQGFFRMSYYNTRGGYPPPLGYPLDGGGYGSDGPTVNMGENYVLSDTHIFNQNLINQFRFGYNWVHAQFLQPDANVDVAKQVGLGGIPYQKNNGGLPSTSISGISSFGSPGFYPSIEYENTFQIIDTLTKVIGNNTIKMGANFQKIRFSVAQPINPHGSYNFNGKFTSNPGQSFTGSGVADFLANEMNYASLSDFFNIQDARWYDAAFVQDNWKTTNKLTLNLGIRYGFFEAPLEKNGDQAYWNIQSITGPGEGTAQFLLPDNQKGRTLAPLFTSDLKKDNIALRYSPHKSLALSQFTNFSPRIGIAYQVTPRTVVRAGFGTFYGGLESIGGAPNPGYNYPFSFTDNFPSPGCANGVCPTNGITLENGFSKAIATGLQNYISTPGLVGGQLHIQTPYTEQYNLSIEHAFTPTMTLTTAYVGNVSRHMQVLTNQNAPVGLVGPNDNSQLDNPFPAFGGAQYDRYKGTGSYNSLQVTLQKHTSRGLYFLATYTWAHAMDDTATPLNGGTNIFRNPNIFPIGSEYANSDWDVKDRFVFSGYYQLPFGRGKAFLNHRGLVNQLAGGWSTDLVFYAMTGNPFTVSPDNAGANGAGARRAIVVSNPFAAGGTAPSSNAGTECATSTRNINHWYNPCAFANPLPGSDIPDTQTAANPVGNPIRSPGEALKYVGGARNQLFGPGYERINMSVFKDFPTVHSQYVQFRADIFNLFNTPAFGNPNGGIGSNGGQITGLRSLGAFTPNSRFVQFALKYDF